MKPPARPSFFRRALTKQVTAWLLAAQAVAAAGPAATAWADEATERATGKAIKAQALFKSGQFIKAAEAFLEAYAVAPKATLLFNAARAYEEARALDEAIALYERYLTLKDADAAGKADARKRLNDLTERRAAGAPVQPPEARAEPVRHVEPQPLPLPPAARKAGAVPGAAPSGGPADAEAKRGAQAAAADVDVEVSAPLWFLLGCAVIGIPLAYLSEPAPTPSRMLGRSEVWVASYSATFRQLAADRHRKMALYGCLSGLAITVISGAMSR